MAPASKPHAGFKRIAIVNRGEAAVRLIRAVRELDFEHGSGMRTIVLHTEDERRATFVLEADEAVVIGGETPYLDHRELERALRESRADAAWVGWGFVAQDPAFAELCARIGVVFIGPPPEVMRRLDEEEIAALSGARRLAVPVIADDHGTVWAAGVHDRSIQRGDQTLIEESGCSVLGAAQERELRAAAVSLARSAGYRGAGSVEFLYRTEEKSFALQRLEPCLSAEHPVTELVTGLDLVKLQLHVACGGRLDGETQLAGGEEPQPTAGDEPAASPPAGPRPAAGHVIAARLTAEDPARDFAPSVGRIELLRLPSGPGVRVDTGIGEGDFLPPGYDPILAEVIAFGRDRAEARTRLLRALGETTVVIPGGATNKSLLLDLLDRPEMVAGTADTGWLDHLVASNDHIPTRHADVALLAGAIGCYDAEEEIERRRFYAAGSRGRPQASHELRRTAELAHRGQTYGLAVAQVGPSRYRIEVDGASVDVGVESLRRFQSRLSIGGRAFRITSVADGPEDLVEVDGVAHRVTRDEGAVIRAPAPALVVAVNVVPGDEVQAGSPVALLEAMKMEMTIVATDTGRVREVLVAGNVSVDAGASLLRVDPAAAEDRVGARAPRIDFGGLAALGQPSTASGHAPDRSGTAPGQPSTAPDQSEAGHDAREHLDALRSLIMGFDVSMGEAHQLVAGFERARSQLPADDPALLHGELQILEVFADLAELSRNWPAMEADELEEEAGERVRNPREHFRTYLRSLDAEREGLPEAFRTRLARALARYGVHDLKRGPELEEAVHRIFLAHQRAPSQLPAVMALLDQRLQHADALPEHLRDEFHETLDRLIVATQLRFPSVGELARRVRFRLFDEPFIEQARDQVFANVREQLGYLVAHPGAPDYADRIEALVASPHTLIRLLGERIGAREGNEPMVELLTRRYYRTRSLQDVRSFSREGRQFVTARYTHDGQQVELVTTLAEISELDAAASALAALVPLATEASGSQVIADIYVAWGEPAPDADGMAVELGGVLAAVKLPLAVQRVAVAVSSRGGADVHHFTFRRDGGELAEDPVTRGLHPMIAQRLDLWRLRNFILHRLPAVEDVYLYHCVARENPSDERLVALAEVRDLTPVRDASGRLTALPEPERLLAACLDGIRRFQAQRPPSRRLHGNRVLLSVWPPLDVPLEELLSVTRTLAPLTAGLDLEEVVLEARMPVPPEDELRTMTLGFSYQPGEGVTLTVREPLAEPFPALDEYAQKVLRARRRGTVYPYELIPLLTGDGGTFTEHDLDENGALVAVQRPFGANSAGIVVGVVRTVTERYPEGMDRVALLGDPTKALGSLAEPEAVRIIKALDLAQEIGVPVEWLAVSAGAKISMDSGSETMDWISRVLRRLITFTQDRGEVNVVVAGINVGAQPYFNAEATMLLHTRGILVMTPDGAMVLTGKQALDYSGGVSAEDNFGIGGYDRIMGPNGQAQYWAPDLAGACEILMAHYEHTYVAPGERFPRPAPSSDPVDRDVRTYPHPTANSDFRVVGDIFSMQTNPERKKAFDIRTVMRAVADQDHPPLERWAAMADAEAAVVYDAHLGGYPVTMLGIESRPLRRRGTLPADGPDRWTAGTLFPRSSKKVARALNAASGNRPAVVLANLSGFDGSPESLRSLQLEYGAEIGRAVVNFDGPIVFCVVSRYHGGAFVVFSGTLNDTMEVIAVEGSYASVIGGAPAAATVFARDINARTAADPRLAELEARAEQADDDERGRLHIELAEVRAAVRSEKLGEVAAEFDAVHSVERALRVGSIDAIIPAARLRPHIIEAVERGMARTLERG